MIRATKSGEKNDSHDDDGDDVSVQSSSSQTLINAMANESDRRKAKLITMRKYHSVSTALTSNNKTNNHQRHYDSERTFNSTATTSSPSRGGILTVRTLQESLATITNENNYKTVVDNQRRRRRLRKRLDGVMKDVSSNSNSNCDCNSNNSGGCRWDCRGRIRSGSDSLTGVGLECEASLASSHSNSFSVSHEKFNVKYDYVKIRDYVMIPGDNPR